MLFMSSYIPHEYVATPENISHNETATAPLMSPPDDIPAENEPTENEPGWWKHTGKSSVSYAGESSHQPGDNSGTEEKETSDGPEEIPEFPTMAVPVLVVMSLAFVFRRTN
ncbi:PEF-CTERM sorting domain-containing protein [Methanolobus sp. ZRKC3]|uniref:PEF-CTERM sorting domain-containing protein n=1 Tax=Methanolobus sp. ZRKC3 TaxID=3125786 RepID=UPI003251DE8B